MKPEQFEKYAKAFIDNPELAGHHGYCNTTFARKIADWWLFALSDVQRETVEKTKSRVGMLRQWINEKPTDMLVTNEMIETFLFPDIPKNAILTNLTK